MAKTKVRYVYRKIKHHGSRNKMTLIKATKWGIALLPVAAQAYTDYKAGGANHAVAGVVVSYVPYNMETGSVDTSKLARGYLPLFAAWVFGKVASRVLR